MDRSEIMEIRKIFSKYKKGDSAAGMLCGCFINTKGEVKGRFAEKLFSRSDNEIHKYYALFRKTLANNDADIRVSSPDQKKGIGFLLDKLNATELKNEALRDELYRRIAESLDEGNYTVFLLHYSYDVPLKTADRRKVDDAWEEVYDFFICAVCPVKASKSTLGYRPEKDLICENPQQLQVNDPAFGLLYPSFNSRSSDRENVLCFRTEGIDISGKLLGQNAPALEKSGLKKKASPNKVGPADPIDSSGTYDTGHGSFLSPSTSHISSLDSGVLDNDSHTVRERTISDDDDSSNGDESGIKDDELRLSSPAPHTPPKASDRPVKASDRPKPLSIRGDRSRLKKRLIDGVMYYLVPADDTELV